MKRSHWFVLVVPLSLLLVSSVAGQVRHSGPISVQEALAEKASRGPAEQKISSMVLQAVDALHQAETLRQVPGGSTVFKSVSPDLLRVDKLGRVHLYLYLYPEYDVDHLRSFLDAQSCTVEILEQRFHIAQVWIPFEKVEEVAGLDVVRLIGPAERPITLTGSKLSEGDAVMRADVSRVAFSVDGSGIKVGVISDDVDSIGLAVASGDLPPGVQVIMTDPLSNQQNEGIAMLEIIHDLAPGAGLAFSTASPTSLSFMQSVRDLAAPAIGNCDIIVDDILYLSEPVWEDGPLATVVDSVVRFGGVAYFSSAGNQAEVTYVENFAGGGPQLGLTDVHLYAFNDPAMLVSLAPGAEILSTLHWNNPYGSSADDYDLYIFDAALQNILAVSNDIQNGFGNPVEIASYKNNDNDEMFINIVVNRAAGSPTVDLHLVNFGNEVTQREYILPVGGIYGHACAPNAVAVGAIPSSAFSSGSYVAEPFSTFGPRQMQFPAPAMRNKPEIAGIDGVSITGAGGFGQQIPPSSGNYYFFGTSAAAPHAAAVAALLLEADPTLTPAQITQIMTGTAVDLGVTGWDFNLGEGRLDAYNVLAPRGRAYFSDPKLPLDPGHPLAVDTISITDVNTVNAVMVSLVCAHTFVGDLIVELEAPGAPPVLLMQHPGPPPMGDDGNNPNIVLDDNAPLSIDSINFGASQDIFGYYYPFPGNLSTLGGVQLNGDWILRIMDVDPGFNNGMLYHWGLSFALATGIEDPVSGEAPARFALHQNYPNPFNPSTIIRYELPEQSRVRLKVFNILGEEIATLVDEVQDRGTRSVVFPGAGLASGVYLYRLTAGNHVESKMMMLVR